MQHPAVLAFEIDMAPLSYEGVRAVNSFINLLPLGHSVLTTTTKKLRIHRRACISNSRLQGLIEVLDQVINGL